MADKARPARRHHVVSKFYLRGFADSRNLITRVPLGSDGSPRTIGLTDATVRRDFYRVEIEGTEPDEFERALGEIESLAAPAFRRLITTHDEVSHQDRYLIAMWAALQHLRSESTRQAGDEIGRSLYKLELGVFTTSQVRERLQLSDQVTDSEVETIRARMLSEVDTWDINHHRHLQLIQEALPGTTNLVFYRDPWVIHRYERKSLATSDTPLAMAEHTERTADGLGVSIGTAAGLYLPVSRRIGILMGDLPPFDENFKPTTIQGAGSAYAARVLNQMTVWNARRAVFHHPEDEPLTGLHPGSMRKSEILIPDTDDLIRGFARSQGRNSGLSDDAAN